jgi:uncharacterized protein
MRTYILPAREWTNCRFPPDDTTMIMRHVLLPGLLLASTAHAQSAFVSVRNGDTIQIETTRRSATRLDGDLVMKGGPRIVYASDILPDGRLGTMTITIFAPGARADAAPMMRGKVSVIGDTALAVLDAEGRAPVTQRIPSKAGAQPIVNTTLAMFEPMIAAARRAGTPTAVTDAFLASGGTTIPIAFSNLHTDSVTALVGPTAFWMKLDSAGRIQRAGIPSQQLAITRVDGIAVSKLALARTDYSVPSGAPYTAESVTVPTTMGHTLGGTLTKPSGVTGPMPVAITITGSGAQDRDEMISIVPKGYRLFRQVADTLGRRGIAVLRMDDRGYGESGGSFSAATSRDFANDIRAAIAFLRGRPDVDRSRIFLVGHSEGGLIAPMVAAEEPGLAGIVLMAGTGRNGREILTFQQTYALDHDTSLTTAARAAQRSRVAKVVDSAAASSPWMGFFVAHDPLATARRVKTPVLILQGADDQQVIAREADLLEAAFKAAKNRDITKRVFPELNHLFIRQKGGDPSGYASLPTNLAEPAVLGVLADWIVARAASPMRR